MAQINVDTQYIRNMANSISSYITSHEREMAKINQAMVQMNNCSSGDDFTLLNNKWASVKGMGSTSQEMIEKLKKYRDFLNSCAEEYESAVNNAKQRASWI